MNVVSALAVVSTNVGYSVLGTVLYELATQT